MSKDSHTSAVVNESQLFGWRHRVREIEEEMKTLGAERGRLTRLIEMAEELSAEAGLLASARGETSSRLFIHEALSELEERDAFPKAVMAIVERSADGASYDDIREAILKSPLAKRFRKSDKGFYHALRRLKNAGEIMDYHGYMFTPANLAAFQKLVIAGLKADKGELEKPARATKMTAMILEIVAENPGMIAKDVIAEICRRDSELAVRLENNDGTAYNAISRFKKRGEIEGYGHLERQLRIGPNASDEIKRLARSGVVVPIAKRTEAPTGKTGGASETGRGGNPDLFAQPVAPRR